MKPLPGRTELLSYFVAPALLMVFALGILAHRGIFSYSIVHGRFVDMDERVYFGSAAKVWEGVLPPSDFSPGWCLILAPFCIGAYDDNGYLIVRLSCSLLLVLTTYIAILRNTNWIIASTCTATFCLMTILSFAQTLYIAAALGVALTSCFMGDNPSRRRLVILFMLGLTTVRVEFLLPAIVVAGLMWSDLVSNRSFLRMYFLTALIIFSYTMLGPKHEEQVPEHYRKGGRSMFAFAQHYAWTANDLHLWDGDHWTECSDVMKRDFGDSSSLAQCLLTNPRAFGTHLVHNVEVIPYEFFLLLRVGDGVQVNALVPAVLVIAGILALIRIRAQGLPARARSAAQSQLSLLCSLPFLFVPWMIIRPKHEYQFYLLPAFLVLVGWMISIIVPRNVSKE